MSITVPSVDDEKITHATNTLKKFINIDSKIVGTPTERQSLLSNILNATSVIVTAEKHTQWSIEEIQRKTRSEIALLGTNHPHLLDLVARQNKQTTYGELLEQTQAAIRQWNRGTAPIEHTV